MLQYQNIVRSPGGIKNLWKFFVKSPICLRITYHVAATIMMKSNETTSTPASANSDSASNADCWTTQRLLTWIAQYLEERNIESPRLHAEILLSHILNCQRVELYTAYDRPASRDELNRLRELVRRAATHEPVAYLTGEAWFFGLRFSVSPAVLIPRPSTETIIEYILQHERTRNTPIPQQTPAIPDVTNDDEAAPNPKSITTPPPPIQILDLCTGSGCIAVTLAKHLPHANITASDISPTALQLAEQNAKEQGVSDRIQFIEGSLFTPISGHFDYIVSNPPYISDPEWEEVPTNVKDYEPTLALRAGPHGLDYLQPIIENIHQYLNPESGKALLEISSTQETDIHQLIRANPHLNQNPITLPDLEGYPRVIVLKLFEDE